MSLLLLLLRSVEVVVGVRAGWVGAGRPAGRPTLPLPSSRDKLMCACSGPPSAVVLEFKHNVCGREVYAEGTVDAAIFLHRQVGCACLCNSYSWFAAATFWGLGNRRAGDAAVSLHRCQVGCARCYCPSCTVST